MPTVSGRLLDIGLAPLAGLNPVLEFRPSSAAVDSRSRVFPSRQVEVTPDPTGAFSVSLASTDELLPIGAHWKVRVKWLSATADGRNFPPSDDLPFKLFVPPEGGDIADLIGEYVANDWVYQGPNAPLLTNKARWQLNTSTGDLFAYQDGSFVKIANLRGPKGEQGSLTPADKALLDAAVGSAEATVEARDEALAAVARLEAVQDTNDGIMSSVVADPASLTRRQVELAVTPNTYYVDHFKQSGDVSDSESWARALAAAKADGGNAIIQGGPRVYEFHTPVSIVDVSNITFRGTGEAHTIFQPSPATTTRLHSVFLTDISEVGVIENITFEDFTVLGGMLNPELEGLARNEREFNEKSFTSAIRMAGNRMPGRGSRTRIRGITTRRITVNGVESLPMLFEGVSELTTRDCTFIRTLDWGATHTDVVTVANNVSLWAGDNGFSISRGCTNAVIAGNVIKGCVYWGVWVAGFAGEAGASGFSVTGNTVETAGYGGINCDDGARNGTVAGNTVRDARRGYIGTGSFGIGVYVKGLSDGTVWADNITVSGNTLIDCARAGVLVRQNSRNVTVTGNLVVRPGTAEDHTGATVQADSVFENCGVAVAAQGGEEAKFANITLTSNTAFDDRAVPLMNHAVARSSALGDKVQMVANRGSGARSVVQQGDTPLWSLRIADPRPQGSLFELDSTLASQMRFLRAGNNRFGIKQDTTNELKFTAFTDGGTEREAFHIDRDNARMVVDRPMALSKHAGQNARPSATTFGAGTMIYDTALNRPLFSDGSVWRNADGTAV